MKSVIFVLFFVTSFVHGQSTPAAKPAYFIDGINYGANIPQFNPELIQTLTISKEFVDKANNFNGAINITTKTPNKFNFLSVNDIIKANKVEPNGPILYMLNKEFIKETQQFKIDAAFVYKVDIMKGAEFDNLKSSVPNLCIVKIYTNTKENWPSSELRIRGSASKEK